MEAQQTGITSSTDWGEVQLDIQKIEFLIVVLRHLIVYTPFPNPILRLLILVRAIITYAQTHHMKKQTMTCQQSPLANQVGGSCDPRDHAISLVLRRRQRREAHTFFWEYTHPLYLLENSAMQIALQSLQKTRSKYTMPIQEQKHY